MQALDMPLREGEPVKTDNGFVPAKEHVVAYLDVFERRALAVCGLKSRDGLNSYGSW